jgi:large subunit ribosomal protein L32e
MMPSGHKAFLVSNVKEVELLLMMNKTYAAECVEILVKNASRADLLFPESHTMCHHERE